MSSDNNEHLQIIGNESLLKELKVLEHELHHPGAPCSRGRLEALLHPDFHEVGRSGCPYDRETVIRYLVSLETWPDVAVDNHTLDVVSHDCALLTYRSADRSQQGVLSRHTLRSSLWLRVNGQWRLFYHQATPAKDSWE